MGVTFTKRRGNALHVSVWFIILCATSMTLPNNMLLPILYVVTFYILFNYILYFLRLIHYVRPNDNVTALTGINKVVLHCIVLYCIVLYCIVLYCIVLYCIVLYCIVWYGMVLYCIVLPWQYKRRESTVALSKAFHGNHWLVVNGHTTLNNCSRSTL